MRRIEEGEERDDLIRQVFDYANRYRGRVFVFHLNYRDICRDNFRQLVNDLVLLHRNGIGVVVIPGARERIDEILAHYRIETRYHGGIRVTSEEALPFVKMAAFDVANRVLSSLSALRINGIIGNWVEARALGVVDGYDYLQTGRVTAVSRKGIMTALDHQMIPILPCVGWNRHEHVYNVSSEELLARTAIELEAEKVFFIDHSKPPLPSSLNAEQAARTAERTNDSRLKVAAELCSPEGVGRVHLLNDASVLLSETFSNAGAGAMVFADTYERIRPMKREEIPDALRLMEPSARTGNLIARSFSDLEQTLGDYYVYEADRRIHAVAALHSYGNGSAEIAAITVDNQFKGRGIGKRLIRFLLEQAKKEGAPSVFALTTQTADWFLSIGFEPGAERDLPSERTYDSNRNSRVLVRRF